MSKRSAPPNLLQKPAPKIRRIDSEDMSRKTNQMLKKLGVQNKDDDSELVYYHELKDREKERLKSVEQSQCSQSSLSDIEPPAADLDIEDFTDPAQYYAQESNEIKKPKAVVAGSKKSDSLKKQSKISVPSKLL